jgi:hypothetical protein
VTYIVYAEETRNMGVASDIEMGASVKTLTQMEEKQSQD